MAKSETPARDAVLVKYLNEAFGKEKQLETALQAQIAIVNRPQLKKGLQDHLKVTKAQARGLTKRIKELGGSADGGPDIRGPEVASNAAGAVANLANRAVAAAKGPVQALRGTSEADNDLRNIRDCYWNEAEEIAHYNVIEAVATELGDKETARLAKTYRKEEEKMQTLLARQIPQVIKSVVREEVPAAERRGASGRRSSSRRASSSRSTTRSASRSSSSRSSGTKASRSATAQKSASTRNTKAAGSAAKQTAKSAGSTARKAGQAARSTAKRATKS